MAKKSKSKNMMAIAAPESSDRQRASVSVRKIKNGYISERSGHIKDDPYKSEEMFHPKKPNIAINVGGLDVQGDAPAKPSTSPKAKMALKQRMSKTAL